LISSGFHPTTPGVEDWEQFFIEKSRRRFDKERNDRRRQRRHAMIAAVLIGLLLLGSFIALAVLR